MQETSNIIEDTFSAYNICKGRFFEEINKYRHSMGSRFRKIHQTKDSFLKHDNFL